MSGAEAASDQSVCGEYNGGKQWETVLLQDEIRQRERELVSLRLQLNAVASIMRLPDELLLEVFYLYLAWWRATYGHDGFFPSYSSKIRGHHGWVLITHVCHHWRTVALSASLLWTDIKINRQSLAYAFLARSKQAPLNIQCRIVLKDVTKNSRKFQTVKAALAQSHRIRSLLFQYSSLDPETGDPTLASPELGRYEFPQLRDLTLWLDGGYDTTLPAFIARGSFPKLRTLETRMYNLSNLGKIARAPHLTRIKLTAFNGRRALTWMAFFQFFAALPQLEVLILMEGLPRVRTMLNEQILELPTAFLAQLSSNTCRFP
ncbi:hypothetical protein PHLGIDRAFT_321111 [Phlebiopsis gigantea 11061_1 CR5-6]|uniref:Uncharacterized protein n=1 Tax=Phlebiopsis gigantea (strain 11061_1 CR5-6) TaxID=745531 RepID=A0A0C3PAR4_PHLG1|nr:hypothetical protein PHLGIDRAFT_321111 [Phlebiopsis gigantea 11061_1 CR5-6]